MQSYIVLEDEFLIEALQSASGTERIEIAVYLGESVGTNGPDVLRALIKETGRGSRDLRCAAIVALAKRCGADAAEDLTAALAVRNADISRYAAAALAHVQGKKAWPAIFDRLADELNDVKRNRVKAGPPKVIIFLAQNCTTGSDDALRFISLLRNRWSRLTSDEIDWLSEHLPDLAPGGPEASDVVMPVASDADIDPLFRPLFEERLPPRQQL